MNKILENKNNVIVLQDDNNNVYLYSYTSLVLIKNKAGEVTINKKYYKFSKTTTKHINNFLELNSKEVEERIKSGKIKLVEF